MATRPTYTKQFEETEAAVQDRILGNESLQPWRKEPGDFMYDAVITQAPETVQLEVNQDTILKNSFALYAEDDWLDLKLAEVGLTRLAATATVRRLLITAAAGIVLPKGHMLTTLVLDKDGNPIEWTADEAITWAAPGQLATTITSTQIGAITNVPAGSEFMLQPPIPGISVIVDDGAVVPGSDRESNDDAWARYDFKVKHPDTGGNKNDYVRWAQEVAGVGKARCVPRWNGVGTVKVLVLGTDYKPAAAEIVADVQEYIDPGKTGLGDGKAPCGATVTVAAPANLAIDITATITWAVGADAAKALAAFQAAIDAYLKAIVFTGQPVVYNRIGSMLIGIEGVVNYTDLMINGGATDIPVGDEEVATRGAVTI
jgi:uncharacterized phage protein gp47/JayE